MDHTLNLAVKTEAILEELRAIVTRLGPDVLGRLAGLEPAEVVASPYGLRAVLLGLEQGATSVHLERRLELPWPESFTTSPEVASDARVLDAGVWQMGKYRGFFQDAPFGTFNPNHVAKWVPPNSCTARWASSRPGATRWEHYLGARLNELVPVALWYGLTSSFVSGKASSTSRRPRDTRSGRTSTGSAARSVSRAGARGAQAWPGALRA